MKQSNPSEFTDNERDLRTEDGLVENIALTIAIPTLNGERFLRETVQSVAGQLDGGVPVELLIVDNASTDATSLLCDELRLEFPVIRVVRHSETVPFNQNVNLAIENAKGNHVWVLADDDCLVEGSVSKVKSLLSEINPSVLLTRFMVVDENLELIHDNSQMDQSLEVLVAAKKVSAKAQTSANYSIFWDEASSLKFAGFDVFGLLSAIVVRRDTWMQESSRIQLNLGDGFDFLYLVPRLMMMGPTVVVNQPVVLFRQYAKRWQTRSDYHHEIEIYFVVIPRILGLLRKVGFSPSTLSQVARHHLANLTLHIGVAKSKGLQLKMSDVNALIKANARNPIFWLQFPVIFLPAKVVNSLSKVYTSPFLAKIAKGMLSIK